MTEENKPSYYAVIPAEVRYDNELKPNAKLFYGEITCLSQKEGYCFASNSYFAELYGVDTSTVSKWVNQLASKGYIQVDYIYEGKECKQRRIEINQYLLKKNQGGIEKKSIGYCKNAKDNNTSINNINNNNTSKEKEQKHKYGTYNNVLLSDKELEKLYADMGEERTKKAIEFLSSYKVEKAYVTKSDNLTLRRWVFSAIDKPSYSRKGLQTCDQFSQAELNQGVGF